MARIGLRGRLGDGDWGAKKRGLVGKMGNVSRVKGEKGLKKGNEYDIGGIWGLRVK